MAPASLRPTATYWFVHPALAGRSSYRDSIVIAARPPEVWAVLIDVERWVREQSGLTSLKRPKRFVAVESIPTSAVGKILRRRLTQGEYDVLADSEAQQ